MHCEFVNENRICHVSIRVYGTCVEVKGFLDAVPIYVCEACSSKLYAKPIKWHLFTNAKVESLCKTHTLPQQCESDFSIDVFQFTSSSSSSFFHAVTINLFAFLQPFVCLFIISGKWDDAPSSFLLPLFFFFIFFINLFTCFSVKETKVN